MPAAKPYRRGVGIVLVNARGRVFVAERIDTPGAWQMPQGGIDKNETPRQAALRELREETGTTAAKIIAVTRNWLRYDFPAELTSRKGWIAKYRGQEQKWFLMKFAGRDEEIDIAGEQPEFSAWTWAKLEDVPEMIVGFKRDIYKKVVEAFKDDVAALRPKRKRAARKTPPRVRR
ncbi:MAG: RNA pyrophosphohydrolase [Rhodospirillaceae bacterium]